MLSSAINQGRMMEIDLSIEVRDLTNADGNVDGVIWGVYVKKGSRKLDKWGEEILAATILGSLVESDPAMQAAMEAFLKAICDRIMRLDHGEHRGEFVVRTWGDSGAVN